ncbi:hypothetical protein FHX41_1246 [Actinomadura hallensis]|uniref:Uncharacterized protein n=1 Tax=Actinomadura hallensis TaxID=337895 RepID=A0A543IAL7_9ACTN|nr:hypothetical protein [Actinomadura hallensis]TQM67628.1 hypothetical protein FHX41_1246 [Actinomadura hallensis]HLV76170.1 hypothetical protein [Vulgatibacteraceae bacterium]
MNLEEAARQLKMAAHDAQVAFDCIGLGDLDRAQEHAVTLRAAADAAEVALSRALRDLTPEQARAEGERAISAMEGA